ncbi:hypothetical protein EW145_g3271 [Phellinidium pouzarii]|uniref:FAD/NAD(P)-binding domain-containing protein n=1 Tax=Phellinidium pouzarii TaxID=167371 RepID=A0A4S4L9N4_9AGAM|nr:hypothetical protein EW145_g3271 [Phellinidium pouzarii]
MKATASTHTRYIIFGVDLKVSERRPSCSWTSKTAMTAGTLEHRQVAVSWLAKFSCALTRKSARAVSELFLPDGWLRDSLVLSWDTRSLEGRDRIEEYLRARLPLAHFDSETLKLDDAPGLASAVFSLSRDVHGIEAAFVFETPMLHGRGFMRLQLEAETSDSHSDFVDSDGRWKALSLYIATGDIKGHEEADHELGVYGGHTLSWDEVLTARRLDVESNPEVLVIGAGQTGLQVAARLQQMNIRTIIVERNERVGDNWRKRYPTLSLNTPRTHHCLLYAPFPRTWPTFTPRDKVASWLELYAESLDLTVWTSSCPLPGPTYDSSARRWSVTVNKSGTFITLHPAHIIIATGTLGDPFTPRLTSASLSLFKGRTLHAAQYAGGTSFARARVLVVGAGTSAADICQDLVARGAHAVTMLQRRPTLVVSRKAADAEFAAWPEGVPVEVSDFCVAASPLGLLGRIARTPAERERRAELDREMWEKLERRGLKIEDGSTGGGRRELVYERLGGYWIDVGAAKLIINGKVAVKSGVEIARFAEDGAGVVFTDGSSMDVDVVIFATGYENIRPSMKRIFGAEVIDQTQPVWGLDKEGELRGCYRPSGHPGLWYAAGDFYHSRYMSKQLALLIKSDLLGLTTFENLASIPSVEAVDTDGKDGKHGGGTDLRHM